MSKKQSNATKQAASERAAERAAAFRAEQQSQERRKRVIIVSSVVIAVLILVVAIVASVQAGRDTTGQVTTPPAGAVEEYGLAMGADDAKVVVTVYEDPMCPFCGLFEQASSERLKEYADSGDVQVRYHMVSFLDDASTSNYSTRAANAVGVVLDTAGAEAAVKFHTAIFDNQPEEGSAGISDAQLIEYAVEAGASEDEVKGPIEDLKFAQWVENATGAWSKAGFTSTPTVTVDGEKVEFETAAELLTKTEAAIDAALAT